MAICRKHVDARENIDFLEKEKIVQSTEFTNLSYEKSRDGNCSVYKQRTSGHYRMHRSEPRFAGNCRNRLRSKKKQAGGARRTLARATSLKGGGVTRRWLDVYNIHCRVRPSIHPVYFTRIAAAAAVAAADDDDQRRTLCVPSVRTGGRASGHSAGPPATRSCLLPVTTVRCSPTRGGHRQAALAAAAGSVRSTDAEK